MENNKLSKALKLKILVVLAIAVTLSLGFYAYEEPLSITLHLDQKVEQVASKASTVGEFLKEQDITISEKGYINVSLDKELDNNMDIIIRRPKSYTISLAGAEWDVMSTYNTVEEILTDSGVNYDENDIAIPALKSRVYPGHKISLFRVYDVVEIEEEKIPFDSIVRKNPKLEIGNTKTIQEGEEGLKKIETKTRFINGHFVKKEIVKEEIVSEAINNVVEKGAKDRILTSRGDTNYKKMMVMTATAYDLSFESCGKRPGDKYYGITASGTKARPGAVAVDPRVIPLGTKLYIESLDSTEDYGFAVAEDTGGAIKGKKIDLFFHSATDVKNYGRRKVKVYILD